MTPGLSGTRNQACQRFEPPSVAAQVREACLRLRSKCYRLGSLTAFWRRLQAWRLCHPNRSSEWHPSAGWSGEWASGPKQSECRGQWDSG